MAVDEMHLGQKYEVVRLNVRSSNPISTRTANVISKLTQQDTAKPIIVTLTANAKVANKLISIVEIAKRELASNGVKCFQYNTITSELVSIPRESRKKTSGGNDNDDGEDEQSDGVFETMGAPMGATKKRSMPVMTVFLSTTSVRELKAQYGEQK